MSNAQSILAIPRHNLINAFTMGGLVRDAGLTVEQFRELLYAGAERAARPDRPAAVLRALLGSRRASPAGARLGPAGRSLLNAAAGHHALSSAYRKTRQ